MAEDDKLLRVHVDAVAPHLSVVTLIDGTILPVSRVTTEVAPDALPTVRLEIPLIYVKFTLRGDLAQPAGMPDGPPPRMREQFRH